MVVVSIEFCVVCCADVWVDAGVGVDVGVVVWVIVDCWSVEVFETGVGVGIFTVESLSIQEEATLL